MLKRLFDIIFSATGLLVLAPLMAIVWVLIIWRDGSPAVFRQLRVGRNGLPFMCYKFRTMANDTRHVASHLADHDKISPLGHTLRRTKLDELPQLINVLKGEMSFVGPRPSLISQTELIAERKRLNVLRLRPGITGISQIRGIDMRDPVRLAQSDADYLHGSNVLSDIAIIVKTLGGVRQN